MKNVPANHLKLYVERPIAAAGTPPAVAPTGDLVDRLCSAFTRAVGRPLEFRADDRASPTADGAAWTYAVPASTGHSAGVLRMPSQAPQADGELDDVCRLAESVGDLLGELQRTRRALWKREAELAAGVPLVPQPQPERHLAERLEAVLKGTAEALGCHAAAVYMLDAATTELKLRGAWNLPVERFLAPPRPLPTAVADIEALAGHAVVLEDTANYASWNLPEQHRAAVCIPVSSPTTPLGTLWIFADSPRGFTDQEVSVVELGAGRIAADLEREMLLCETRDAIRLRRAWSDAEERRRTRMPQIAPLCERWEVAGRMLSDCTTTGEFYDWTALPDGALCIAVGAVDHAEFSAALDIEALRASWRAHSQHERSAGRLLDLLNADLWSGSAETSPAHMLHVRADVDGRLHLAAAGRACAAKLSETSIRRIESFEPPLGSDPQRGSGELPIALSRGESLILADDPRLLERLALAWPQATVGMAPAQSAARLLDRLSGLLDSQTGPGTLVVLRQKA